MDIIAEKWRPPRFSEISHRSW